MAPAIRTSTCCQVGAVKPSLNGRIQAVNLFGTTRLEFAPDIRPPNRRLGARIGDRAFLHFAYQEIVEVAVKEAAGNEGAGAIVE